MMHADVTMIVCFDLQLAQSALSMLVSSLNTHMDHVMHALYHHAAQAISLVT